MNKRLSKILAEHAPIDYGTGFECKGCETFDRVSFSDCPVQPLQARVRELEDALAAYANQDNWASIPTCREDYWKWDGPENDVTDPGLAARAALAGTKE